MNARQSTAALSSPGVLCFGRAYARITQVGSRAYVEAGGKVARYAVGGMPYVRVKDDVNDPTLCSPTAMQTSATERSVLRSNVAARSSRRVSR